MDDNEILVLCLQKIELHCSNLTLSLPFEGSELYEALNIPRGQEWKLGSLVDNLIWLQKLAKDSSYKIRVKNE